MLKVVAVNLLAVVFVVTDQLFKYFVLKKLHDSEVFFIDNFLSLTLVKNYYLSYGIKLHKVAIIVLMFCIVFILLWLLIRSYKKRDLALVVIQMLIIAGALSNLIDRVTRGFVIDYIHVQFWTVFNLADVMIVFGIVSWILYELLYAARFKRTA